MWRNLVTNSTLFKKLQSKKVSTEREFLLHQRSVECKKQCCSSAKRGCYSSINEGKTEELNKNCSRVEVNYFEVLRKETPAVKNENYLVKINNADNLKCEQQFGLYFMAVH